MLQNLEVIVSDYAGDVGNPPIYNLINAYGWLEASAGTPCPQKLVAGANFGSPAGGYGGSMNNNEGTPWLELRNAIQYLLSGEFKSILSVWTCQVRGARPQSVGGAQGGDFVDTGGSKNPAGIQGFGLIGKSAQGGYDDVNMSLLQDDDGLEQIGMLMVTPTSLTIL